MPCFALVGSLIRSCLFDCRYGEQAKQTALMQAAWNGHHECVSALIAKGADVNIIATGFRFPEYSGSALMMATYNGHHECMSILIANGANVHIASEVIAIFQNISSHGNTQRKKICAERGCIRVQFKVDV